jgi:cobalt-precorrin 5A hydrolase
MHSRVLAFQPPRSTSSRRRSARPASAASPAALGVPLVLVAKAELVAAGARAQTRSQRVLALTGVPSVAEAAALAAAGPRARLIVPRVSAATATCALAVAGERP